MLAQPRKKQKISVDPQNKRWQNDSEKFGQKMLEKMGWQSGKGLGAQEQGVADPIKLNANFDSRGVGYERKSDDCWLEQQEEFAKILEQLNKKKDSSSETVAVPQSSDAPEEQEGSSLELISKKCKTRIHYHKFAKGKDLSSYKSSDISSILGRRKRKKSETKDSSETKESKDKTVVSRQSVGDYFAEKMKKLRKKEY